MKVLFALWISLQAVYGQIETNEENTSIKLIFYPKNYLSLGEEIVEWKVGSLDKAAECVTQLNFRLTETNSINVNLSENYTENTFLRSQLLQISNFTQLDNENQKFQNRTIERDVLRLPSTKLNGIVFVITRKDYGYTEDMLMQYSYNNSKNQMVNASKDIVLDMNWRSGYIDQHYGNMTSLWGAEADIHAVKESIIENRIFFEFAVFFNAIKSNNPKIGCSHLQLHITFNNTEYNLFKSGQYVFPPSTQQIETTQTTTKIESSTTTENTSNYTLASTKEDSITSIFTVNKDSSTENSLSVEESKENTITTETNSSPEIKQITSNTVDIFHEQRQNSDLKFFESTSYMIDKSFYVILATCVLIVFYIVISVISILYYLRKNKEEFINQHREELQLPTLGRKESDISHKVENAHVINIHIERGRSAKVSQNTSNNGSKISGEDTIYDIMSPRQSQNIYDQVIMSKDNSDYQQAGEKLLGFSESHSSIMSNKISTLTDLQSKESDSELQRIVQKHQSPLAFGQNPVAVHKPSDITTDRFEKMTNDPQLRNYSSIPEVSDMHAQMDLRNTNTMISGIECIGPPDED